MTFRRHRILERLHGGFFDPSGVPDAIRNATDIPQFVFGPRGGDRVSASTRAPVIE